MTMWLTREDEYFSPIYIIEWADRFKEGAEYSAHTSGSKRAYLKEIDA
jgi:hypothetical protein